MAKVDAQGRLVIPKSIREKKGLKDAVEVVEVADGVIIRPTRARSWDDILNMKLKVDWRNALAVSLEHVSLDDLLFG